MVISGYVNTATRSIPPWMLYLLLPVPGIWLFWQAVQNQLGADPLAALEHGLGEYALQLLVLGLLITPVRDLTRINLIRYRRAIGLVAFFYVVAHFAVYLLLDQQLYWDAIWKDISKRPYIIFGMVSFVGMIPLAVTSNNTSLRRLGPQLWRRLHWLVYPAVLCAAAHFVLLKKTWQTEPLVYLVLFVLLIAYRGVKGGARGRSNSS